MNLTMIFLLTVPTFVTKFKKDATQCQLGYYLVIEE